MLTVLVGHLSQAQKSLPIVYVRTAWQPKFKTDKRRIGIMSKETVKIQVEVTTTTTYEMTFGDDNANWSMFPEYNMIYLRNQQAFFNDFLLARGYVFLNDVYDSLGFPRTPAGQIVGWLNNDNGNFVDFHPVLDEKTGAIKLSFNVDGVIYDKI